MKKLIARDVAALHAFIGSRQNTPHAWGRKENDCLSFAAGAVMAQTGKDPARGLQWKDEKSGLKLLKKLGGVEAVLDARFERIPPALAKRGDIGAVPDDRLGVHPMIVEGLTLVCPGERGLRRCKREAMVTAWNVTARKVKPRE